MADEQGGQGGQQGGVAPPAAPWGADPAAEWKVGEGDKAAPWYSFLPEGDTKTLVSDKKYANPVKLAEAYVELNRRASHINDANTLVMPAEGAPQKDWDAFYMKQGRPAEAAGYKDVKWGEGADPRMVSFATDLAFTLGLSPQKAELLATKWNEFAGSINTESEAEQTAANDAAVATLKAGWKGNWDTDMAAGDRVLKALKGQGVTEEDLAAIERHVGVAPVVKMIAALGKLSGEAGFVMTGGLGGQPGDVNAMTQEQAAAEITRLNADKDFQEKYLKSTHPEHQQAADRMVALYVKAGDKVKM